MTLCDESLTILVKINIKIVGIIQNSLEPQNTQQYIAFQLITKIIKRVNFGDIYKPKCSKINAFNLHLHLRFLILYNTELKAYCQFRKDCVFYEEKLTSVLKGLK